jgi:hypothetical protein
MKKLIFLFTVMVLLIMSIKAQINGLVFRCTFDDVQSITNPSVGLSGTFKANPSTNFTTGKFGKAYIANYDEDDMVTFPSEIIPANRATIAFWGKVINMPSTILWAANPYFFETHDINGVGYGFGLNGNNGSFGGGLCGWVNNGSYTTGLYSNNYTYAQILGDVDAWHFYVLKWDAGGVDGSSENVKMYLDGQQNGSCTYYGSNCSSTFNQVTGQLLNIIEIYANNGTNTGSAAIDEFKIYNRALTNAEIQTLYNENLTNNYTISTTNQTQTVDTFEIAINTSELTQGDNIIAYQFDFNYDSTMLKYIGNSLTGTLAENGSLQANSITGKLSVAWARQTPIVGTGPIIKLKFQLIANGTTTPTINNALFNTTAVNTTNGTITTIFMYGDIDGNNLVQAYDAALALQYSVGIDPIPLIDPIPWEDWRVLAANVDGQNGITANDASEILKFTVGLIKSFPVTLKSSPSDNANVNISIEGGFIIFKSSGDLFGLNIYVNEHKNLLGTPQFFNSNMLTATNISISSYAIGLATPTSPVPGETLLKIPYTAGQDTDITFDMIINTTKTQVTIGLSTGIAKVSKKEISIFPNPACNTLMINGTYGKLKISIFDLIGKMVYCINNKNVNQIDISCLPNGAYFITIETEDEAVTKKFIKR